MLNILSALRTKTSFPKRGTKDSGHGGLMCGSGPLPIGVCFIEHVAITSRPFCRHGPRSCLLSSLSSCAGQLNRAGQPGQESTSTADTRDHEICEGRPQCHWLCHQVGTTQRKRKSSCEGRSQHVPFSRPAPDLGLPASFCFSQAQDTENK